MSVNLDDDLIIDQLYAAAAHLSHAARELSVLVEAARASPRTGFIDGIFEASLRDRPPTHRGGRLGPRRKRSER